MTTNISLRVWTARRLLVGALALPVLLAAGSLPGCIIVTDREVHYRDDGSSRQGRIGVEIDGTSSALAAQTGADRTRSCVLTDVVQGSPAEQAGLRRYDVVTHIDGRDYASPAALREAIRGRRPGETLELTVVRGGKPQTIGVVVGSRERSSEE